MGFVQAYSPALLFETGLNYPDSFGCHWQKTLRFDKLERSGFEVGRFRAGLIEILAETDSSTVTYQR